MGSLKSQEVKDQIALHSHEIMQARKTAAFTQYFSEDEAGQVRAAFLAAGAAEGDASVSDFIVRATMREVTRLQRKHNQNTKWDPVPPGS